MCFIVKFMVTNVGFVIKSIIQYEPFIIINYSLLI